MTKDLTWLYNKLSKTVKINFKEPLDIIAIIESVDNDKKIVKVSNR